MLYKIIQIILCLTFLFLFGLTIHKGLEKYEINECHTWIKESSIYRGYYFTNWQIEQCNAHGIELPDLEHNKALYELTPSGDY